MQLEFDLVPPIPAPAIEPVAAVQPERRGELVAFPLSRHLLVQQIAGRMRSIRDDAAREADLTACLRRFFRSRRDDGLSFSQARADLKTFEAAIRAEYRRPTPPPTRWRDHNSLVSFPEKTNVQQTA